MSAPHRILPAATLFLVSCAPPDPLAGRWQGDDLPVQLQSADGTMLSFIAQSDLSFKTGKATFTLTLQTQTKIDLGTAELRASYVVDTSVNPNTATLTMNSISVTPITGMGIEIGEDAIAAGGTLICFPLAGAGADVCVERERSVEFSVDGDTLRFFLNTGAVRVAAKFTRA